MEQIKANETLVDSSLRETKMHGTVDFPVGVYLDDFSDFKNGYICWHWHEEIQISWIIEGEFLCQMEGRTVHLHPGELIFVNRGVLHQIYPVQKGYGKLYAFIWDPEFLSGSADGLYYQATVEAVKAFQEALGWTPTGIASTDVLAVLFSSAAPSKTPASSTPSAYTELSIGSQGTAVYALQSRLVALGYAYGEPSSAGSYGPATAEAVKRFQQALGWEQTGVATVELQQRLYAADAPVYAPVASPTAAPVITPAPTTGLTTYQVLQEGNSGSDVAALQARLVELGYASGTPNGTYGQATAEAVVRFQNMIGLYAQTDMGVATVSLQQILYSPYAPRYVEQNAYNLNAYEALEYGSSGNAVYNLKVRLQELGYLGASNPGYEDIFDENTLFAISNVQLMLGVQETDGVATPELQAFLFSDAALALAIQS